MAWMTLDRGLLLGGSLGPASAGRAPAWRSARQDLQAALLTGAWSGAAGCYTQAIGSDVVDSAVLWMCLSGLVPATDPRMRATVEAVADTLSAPCGLLYRYDGAQRHQSPSLTSTYWLVQCLARAGEVERASAILEQATAYATDLGLLASEGEPSTGELHGTFPDAAAHAGLINAVLDVESALARHGAGTSPR
jgi:GH15 family glucan-1,4-alpha-glucosidase